jgi:AcrR family transcriptional regulator
VSTKERIVLAAQRILSEGGIASLSFDAIARALGVSKQAVLYWFPSKPDLLAELFVGWVRQEAEVALAALEGASTPPQAIAAFVRAVAGFHLGHLDRFRLMYLVPQTLQAGGDAADRAVLPMIHAATGQLYAALAQRLEGPEARRQAMVIHAATLGLVMMLGLAEGIGDPLKHGTEALVAGLIRQMGGFP